MVSSFPPAVVLMGPTAAGKTALSLQIAEAINAEIISVDSAQVYRGMDIGTAKPTPQERALVTHHLIDILDAAESFSTGRFRQQALALMSEITARGKIPLLVGGTMLYFNALLNGLADLPPADQRIRERLDAELRQSGKEALFRRLQRVDPEAAIRIHPNDPQRIQRALEVYEISGKPISSFFSADKTAIPFRLTKIVVAPAERTILHDRIKTRLLVMLKQGLVDEVEQLYRRGDLNESMPSVRTVGYRQVWNYLQNVYDYSTMTEKAIVATRQLAKRQFTWLRRERDAYWLNSSDNDLTKNALNHILRCE